MYLKTCVCVDLVHRAGSAGVLQAGQRIQRRGAAQRHQDQHGRQLLQSEKSPFFKASQIVNKWTKLTNYDERDCVLCSPLQNSFAHYDNYF